MERVAANVLKDQGSEKYRRLRLSNKTVESLTAHDGCAMLLELVGFEHVSGEGEDEEYLILFPNDEKDVEAAKLSAAMTHFMYTSSHVITQVLTRPAARGVAVLAVPLAELRA